MWGRHDGVYSTWFVWAYILVVGMLVLVGRRGNGLLVLGLVLGSCVEAVEKKESGRSRGKSGLLK